MEDHLFYQHHGFDWEGIHRAFSVDMLSGKIKQGGSTITQQLAKNLFLTNDRTIWRKMEEVPLTLELERQLPKSRILELYLNNIDYGMGQHGVQAAAAYYFHKMPEQLTLAESAILVGMVPHPPQKTDGLNMINIDAGRQKALSRIDYEHRWANRYSEDGINRAMQIPIDHLMYPYKTSLDRLAANKIGLHRTE